MDAFEYYVRFLVFSDGTKIELSKDDIVLVVGGNNAGKSQALRDLVHQMDHLGANDGRRTVVKAVDVVISEDDGSLDAFVSTLDKVPGADPQIARMGASMHWNMVERLKSVQGPPRKQEFRRYLRAFTTYLVETENRLQITRPISAIDLELQSKSHPFHYLQDDIDVEDEISKIFRKAFGLDLVVNRTAGSALHVHVGPRPTASPTYDVRKEVREKIVALPRLHEQGDGMRAFVGCLMWGMVANYNIILIDEPEAFLHPPQARLLGRTLVQKRPLGTQLFLATHSGDILRGALDAGAPRLRILRLSRDGNVNRVTELPPTDVVALASDSLLRQTNVLDALFHQQTIVCESDSDCHFYSEVMHVLGDVDGTRANPDVLFLQSYGKSRLAAVAAPLRKLGVPVKVVADFDVLRTEDSLRAIYASLGGAWRDVAEDWSLIEAAISSKKAQLDKSDLQKAIKEALDKVDGPIVPDAALKQIRDAAKKASAWADAKTLGSAFLPAGDITNRYKRLIAKFKAVGLYVVSKGELESFCKSVDGHGPAWVEEVCKRDLAKDPELREAREFTQDLIWGDPS